MYKKVIEVKTTCEVSINDGLDAETMLKRRISERSKYSTHSRMLLIQDDNIAEQFELYLSCLTDIAGQIQNIGSRIHSLTNILVK